MSEKEKAETETVELVPVEIRAEIDQLKDRANRLEARIDGIVLALIEAGVVKKK
jgi:hypothetical protein